MIKMAIAFILMLLVTLIIRIYIKRNNKITDFWTGNTLVFIVCILGILSSDPLYFAIILGYLIGNELVEFIK